MKMQSINRLIIIMTCSLGFLSISASAGQDESQRLWIQKAMQAKQQAQAAEAVKAAKLAECQKLMERDNGASESKK